MDNETINLPLAPKKPYVRPQLHELTGSEADGKAPMRTEAYPLGPS
jgi:hypothetical protein